MFFKSKNKNPKAVNFKTLIGNHAEIDGNVTFAGAIFIEGTVNGDVIPKHPHINPCTVLIGTNGVVIGNVSATTVVVDGDVEGSIDGSDIYIEADATVTGDITYDKISIKSGAIMKGRLIKREVEDSDECHDEARTYPSSYTAGELVSTSMDINVSPATPPTPAQVAAAGSYSAINQQ